MQENQDPRHVKRVRIVQALFASSFNPEQKIDDQAKPVWDVREEIDPMIEKVASEWPVDKLNRIDLAILRLSLYELLYEKQEPVKVILDEAVELAHELGGESSPSFINGVLGTIVEQEKLDNKGEQDVKS